MGVEVNKYTDDYSIEIMCERNNLKDMKLVKALVTKAMDFYAEFQTEGVEEKDG